MYFFRVATSGISVLAVRLDLFCCTCYSFVFFEPNKLNIWHCFAISIIQAISRLFLLFWLLWDGLDLQLTRSLNVCVGYANRTYSCACTLSPRRYKSAIVQKKSNAKSVAGGRSGLYMWPANKRNIYRPLALIPLIVGQSGFYRLVQGEVSGRRKIGPVLCD